MFPAMFKPNFSFFPFEQKEIWYCKPRTRYLMLNPAYMRSLIKDAKPAQGIHTIEHVYLPDEDAYENVLGYFLFGTYGTYVSNPYADVIPKRFWASDAKPKQLPSSFRSPKMIEYGYDELVPYCYDSQNVLLKFDCYGGDRREACSAWGYPFAVAFGYAPLTVTAVAYKIVLLPFKILDYALPPYNKSFGAESQRQANKP